MSASWGGSETVIYHCMRCGETMTEHDIEERGGSIKCIWCGYKILKKTKPPVVRKMKAV